MDNNPRRPNTKIRLESETIKERIPDFIEEQFLDHILRFIISPKLSQADIDDIAIDFQVDNTTKACCNFITEHLDIPSNWIREDKLKANKYLNDSPKNFARHYKHTWKDADLITQNETQDKLHQANIRIYTPENEYLSDRISIIVMTDNKDLEILAAGLHMK